MYQIYHNNIVNMETVKIAAFSFINKQKHIKNSVFYLPADTLVSAFYL